MRVAGDEVGTKAAAAAPTARDDYTCPRGCALIWQGASTWGDAPPVGPVLTFTHPLTVAEIIAVHGLQFS